MPVYRQNQVVTAVTVFTVVGYSDNLIFYKVCRSWRYEQQQFSHVNVNNINKIRTVNMMVGAMYRGWVATSNWWSKINPR